MDTPCFYNSFICQVGHLPLFAAMNVGIQICFESLLSTLLGIYPEVGLLDRIVIPF